MNVFVLVRAIQSSAPVIANPKIRAARALGQSRRTLM